MDQHLNLNKSKLSVGRSRFWPVLATLLGVALAFGASAWNLQPPLTGRLQPGLVPMVLAGLLTAAIIGMAWRGRGRLSALPEHVCVASEPATSRALIAALAAIVILALGVRIAGLLPTVWLAVSVAALGIQGIRVRQAISIGAGLSTGVAVLFAGLLRQPLPLLPQGLSIGGGW